MQTVRVHAGFVHVEGFLSIPEDATAIVVFANPSGSDRYQTRNRHLVDEFNEYRLGTLLFDLMTESEELEDMESRGIHFNIPMLADRLLGAIDWLEHRKETHNMNVGIFGTSTGSAAAFLAAAKAGREIKAVVSKSGRPDLAGESLKHVSAPSMLIVGEKDPEILKLNENAFRELDCKKRLEVIPEASHYFEENGVFEQAAHAARRWFLNHLQGQI